MAPCKKYSKFQYIAIAAGTLSSLAFLPEVWTVVKQKKATTTSAGILFVLFASHCLWLAYSLKTEDNAMAFFSIVSLVIYAFLGWTKESLVFNKYI